jgi:uncharacterized damage-inducible protein DinB
MVKKKAKTAAKNVKKAAKNVKKAVQSAARKVKTAARRVTSRPSGKQVFLDTYAREHATTLRVLRAVPPAQSDFRPHMRSQSFSELAYTLLFEQELKRRTLAGGPVMGGGSPPAKPASWEAAIEAFDKGHRTIVEMLERTPDSAMLKVVQFPTAPGQMGDWPALDFLWFMLHDQIHHRGQLTVMLRMAGGKVPSIYGPSADEPWT